VGGMPVAVVRLGHDAGQAAASSSSEMRYASSHEEVVQGGRMRGVTAQEVRALSPNYTSR
jgi:hypothetical protein